MPSLTEARQNRRLSQGELALQARVGVSTVYRIEHGRTSPRPHIVRRLCAVLGVVPEEIAEFRPVARRNRLGPPSLQERLTARGSMAERGR